MSGGSINIAVGKACFMTCGSKRTPWEKSDFDLGRAEYYLYARCAACHTLPRRARTSSGLRTPQPRLNTWSLKTAFRRPSTQCFVDVIPPYDEPTSCANRSLTRLAGIGDLRFDRVSNRFWVKSQARWSRQKFLGGSASATGDCSWIS